MILGKAAVELLERMARIPLSNKHRAGKIRCANRPYPSNRNTVVGQTTGEFPLDRNTAVQAVPAPAGEIPEGGGVAC